MSDQTKAKLIKLGIPSEIVDKLDSIGIHLPIEIREASTTDLKSAGITTAEIKTLRNKFPALER